MRDNFAACLAKTLRHEGGWSDHPKDPGRATMRGVTIGTYAAFKGRSVTKAELRNISTAEIEAIYRQRYWDKVRGDDLPRGLDLVTFDPAVNSGPIRGAKWLQSALGVAQDGKIGPVTIKAAQNAAPVPVIQKACSARMGFLRGLGTWGTFGKGWSRRVASIEARSVQMAAPAAVSAEQRKASAAATRQETGAAGAAAGGGGIALPDLDGIPVSAQLTIAALILLVGVILFVRGRHDRNRAAAYAALSSED